MKEKFKYILAIDGGGTTTLGVLKDLNGNEIKRHSLGHSSFSICENTAYDNLIKLLDSFLANSIYENQVVIVMGLSGISGLKDKADFISFIESKYKAKLYLTNDAEIALYSINNPNNDGVIMVIGGTGSIVMTLKDNKINRIGGWGHLLGDEGSAYHVTIQAIKNLIHEYENNKSYSLLSTKIFEYLNIEKPLEIIPFVYTNQKKDIASIAILIDELSHYDDFSRQLLVNEGLMISENIIKAYTNYFNNEKVIVTLRGSFVLKANLVKETVINNVLRELENIEFDLTEKEPVFGAFLLAKKLIKEGYFG